MNKYQEAMLGFARDQLGKPYVFGALGPDEWDCRGLVRKAARAAGLDGSVAPSWETVRAMDKWAKENGHYRDATTTPEPGWIFLWGPADGSKPIKGAGHTGLVLEAPSSDRPAGWAISAYNPTRGVVEHRLKPRRTNTRLGLHGYIVLPWPEPEPPFEEPETPPPSGAIDSPTVAELQAKIDAALLALR